MKSGWMVRGALVIGGLILGVIFYAVALIGGSLTVFAMLHRGATVGQPPEVLTATGAPSLQEEISTLLGDLSLGGTTSISEESVNRLLRIAAPQIALPEMVTLHAAEVGLERGVVEVAATVTLALPPESRRLNIQPQTTRIEGRLVTLQGDDGLLMVPDRLALGRVELPDLFVDALLVQLNSRDLHGDLGIREHRSLYLPYSFFASVIPPAIILERLSVRDGYIAAEVRIDDGVRKRMLSEVGPLLREHSPALRQAVREAVGAEHPISHSIARLSDLGEMLPSEPEIPTALLSYVENVVEATPPDAQTFSPQVGHDLPMGTLLETGQESFAECLLREESILRIDEKSAVVLQELPGSSEDHRGRFALLSGRIRAKVAAVAGKDFSFAVAESICGVRGTDLVLALSEGRNVILTVLQGSVSIAQPGQEEQVVPGNHTIQGASGSRPVVISNEEQESLRSELTLKSAPADASALREAWWLWQVVDEARSVAANIAAMDREAQKRLEAEMRARVDIEAIRPRLERILTLPEIQRTLDEYGVVDPLTWLDEAS